MEPIILLYSLIPLWILTVYKFSKKVFEQKNDWKLWLLTITITTPILFFPLFAYYEKIAGERAGLNKDLLKQEFKLRLWICLGCYITSLIITFSLKFLEVPGYGELAVVCTNICLIVLIIACWDSFKALYTKQD